MNRLKSLTQLLFALACVLAIMAATGVPQDFWFTKDQQGDRLLADQDYAQAAEVYLDPIRKGVAFYRDAEFERAAAEFARKDEAEMAYNRGDALMLMGNYDDAIRSFDRALQFRPDWQDARENHAIAVARRDWMKPADDDAGGTGGMLEADEIVFDDRAKNANNTQEVDGPSEQQLSDEELRLLWLQRVQTNPADFLKAKFAYQLARRSTPTTTATPDESVSSSEGQP